MQARQPQRHVKFRLFATHASALMAWIIVSRLRFVPQSGQRQKGRRLGKWWLK
jgi:hypothetical protein